MKKIIVLMLTVIFMLSFIGCNSASDTSNIAVGEKDGIAYFNHPKTMPEIILKGENETIIENEDFFESLVATIDGKSIVRDVCNCEALYVIRIDEYTFGLHTHGISIYRGDSIKAVDLIFSINECTEEEMNKLFEILKTSL